MVHIDQSSEAQKRREKGGDGSGVAKTPVRISG